MNTETLKQILSNKISGLEETARISGQIGNLEEVVRLENEIEETKLTLSQLW